MSDLKSRLIRSCEAWAEAHACGLSRIGKLVAGDANFFRRMERPEANCNVATLERFAQFLADGSNWPNGTIPELVCDFIHVTGVTAMGAQDHGAR